jgi:hypothetical protein
VKNDNFSNGVKTILSRIESHPEEFRQPFGKWVDIQNAVSDRVAGDRNRLRGLSDEEVKALHDKLKEHIWSPLFDEHVIEKVLDPQREERGLDAYTISTGKTGVVGRTGVTAGAPQIYGWNDSSLGAIKPGEIYEVPVAQTSNTTITSKILSKLKL